MLSNPIHPAALPSDELLKSCTLRRGRRRGPGGQHRNKVETAVTIVHTSSGISGEASERRSQEQNRQQAVLRLRVNLALGVRVSATADARRSELWKSRVRSGRISVSAAHDDFPALLDEALDVLAARDFDVKAAAEALTVTSSQLVKFLKLEPRALEQVNRQRSEHGLAPLQ